MFLGTYIRVSLLSINLRIVTLQLSLILEHMVRVTIPESFGSCDNKTINPIIIILLIKTLLIIMLVYNISPTQRDERDK